MGPQSLRISLSVLLFSFVFTSATAIGQANDHQAPASSAFVYLGSCPGACNDGSSRISGFAVAADGTAQPIPGSPFSAASLSLSGNSSFLFAVGGSENQNIFTYAPASNGSLTQAGVVNGLGQGGCGGDQYVQSLSPDPNGHFLDAGVGINSCGTFYMSWSINPSGQLSYISNPDPSGAFAWGTALTFSPNGSFGYTGTVAEYDGSLAGFRRDERGSLIRFSPNAASPPPPTGGSGWCYAWNTASSSAGYVAVMWWSGLYCDNSPDIAIANYTVNSDGTLALVPGSEIVSAMNLENMLYDPSGQYLALVGTVANGNHNEGAIEIYKLQSDGTLVAAGPIQYVPGVANIAWDKANHLYAYSAEYSGRYSCTGTCGLYIFNNNDGVLTSAPGSPHPLQNIVSLAVLPAN